ncbi:RNA-binding domain-containing protein [Parathielavia appendiculata]|uniref:RNA-binding domain-containing protein n=1 Tax=Parathielavia appendiculata TaxID=2587402 RepID=A0AAN6Z4Z8_9PEZI|nr:RNA-binding domain-containing protein [Parathielavia appendiculata]
MADTSQSYPLSQLQLLARSKLQPRQEPLANQNPQSESSDEIVVERLTKNVNEDHLYEIFGQYGEIEDLDLPIGRTTGLNRGTAYILYFNEDDAQSAITHMHEAQLDGAVINVSIVLPRRKVSPPPPVARRGPRGPPANVRSVLSASGGGGAPAGGRGWRSPAAGGGSGRHGHRSGDVYRPRSVSRSRSPAPSRGSRRYRSRSASYTSRSPSRTPPPGRAGGRARRGSRSYGRRRSPSRDSYDSYDRRSRSRSHSRDRR